jgi:hypothetical protein
MVETETMSDPAAMIVSCNEEALLSELPHDFNLIKSHGAK